MTVYPVRRSVRSILWFIACVLLVLVGALAWYFAVFPVGLYDRTIVTIGLGSLTLAALILGLLAYALAWIQRIPRLGSTVFVGYGLAALFVCLSMGWLASALFVDPFDRTAILIVMAYALGVMLALGYLHAAMLSARVEALIGAADALRLGHFHARVELEGNDQLARLGEVFNAMADKLEQEDRKERQLDRMRRELQNWVGSDLRVPLATARATVDALAEGTVDNPETYIRFLRSARRNLSILSDLVDDLYDMAQLETSVLDLHKERTNVAALIAKVVAPLAQAAADKGVVLTGGAAPGLPPIDIDAVQVERVMTNLVAHALHRTPPGGTIKINAYPTRQGALFEVTDHYEGERPEDMRQLLELFLEEDDVRRPGNAGVPLSLAMASTIVQAHGGQIRSERLGSKGLRLVFTLSQDENLAAGRGM
jgi:two-component system sensor histidine kinase BaeS